MFGGTTGLRRGFLKPQLRVQLLKCIEICVFLIPTQTVNVLKKGLKLAFS